MKEKLLVTLPLLIVADPLAEAITPVAPAVKEAIESHPALIWAVAERVPLKEAVRADPEAQLIWKVREPVARIPTLTAGKLGKVKVNIVWV